MEEIDDKFLKKINVQVKKNNQEYNVQAVAKMLNLEDNLPYKKQCRTIISFLRKNKSKNKFIKKILDETSDENICCTLVNVLYSIFNPEHLFLKSPIPISEEEYQNLLERNKKRKLRGRPKQLLEKCLYIKYCHCIKKIYYKNLFKKKILDKNPPSEYAICMSSIYKKRNIKPPPKASYKCRETFNWYK